MFSLKGVWVKRLYLLLILSAGIALRLYKWNGYSFWYDEIHWLMILRDDLLASLKDTIWIAKPPLFRFLVYLWTFVGQDEFTLRLLPFILGILSILFTYKVGKVIFDERIGLIAAFFISFSPFHIYYSQELTHYSLTMLLALCSIYYLIHSLKENKIYSWLKFTFFTTLCLYTNYVSIFLIITENLFFFLSYAIYKNLIKRWLLVNFIILLLFSFWLMLLPEQLRILSIYYPESMSWIPKGSPLHILQILRIFNVGYNANFIVHFFAALLFFPLLLIGIFFNVKKGQEIKLLIIWLFIPMCLSIFFSKISPAFTYRNFIFTLPAYYLLTASGMAKLERYLWIHLFCFLVLSGSSLFNYYSNVFPYPEEFYRPGVHAKKDNRGATKYITDNFKEGDIVVHTCSSTAFPYVYYFFVLNSKNISEIKEYMLKNKDYPFYQWQSSLVIKNEREISKFIKDHNRLWLILSFWEPKALDLYPSIEGNKIKEKLNSNFIMLECREFEGIKVYLYKID